MNNLKVLLVEDDPLLSKLCSKVFKARNFDVRVARDGLEGLNLAYKERPDVIVLDVMLPKMSGYKVCRILKSDPRSKAIPIVMHTCRMEEKDKVIGQQAGADAFVVKNDSVSELVTTIEELASRRSTA